MPSFRAQLQDRELSLAWSLWTELGVSGWERHHASVAIDLEPLIIFTALLGDADPRLRDEALDWCTRFGQLVSASRLRNLLAHASPESQSMFGPFAATANAHTRLRWPHATKARAYRPTGKSRLPDLRRPALVQLRLRALLGVSARAEVVRLFLADPTMTASAADLTPEAGYVKRSVADALDSLRLAGVLEAVSVRNQVRYRLHSDAFVTSLGGLPVAFPRWQSVFRLLAELVRYGDAVEGIVSPVAAAEAASTARRILDDVRALRLDEPPQALGECLPPEFERWALQLADRFATGQAWTT
ncbi:MAG TPA: hypothetical protein VFD49_11065 [Candidatus Dormibacteraeota bacterium]|nr:hypothetical protein [Candidatus Dormibacteraeota bacterium]